MALGITLCNRWTGLWLACSTTWVLNSDDMCTKVKFLKHMQKQKDLLKLYAERESFGYLSFSQKSKRR